MGGVEVFVTVNTHPLSRSYGAGYPASHEITCLWFKWSLTRHELTTGSLTASSMALLQIVGGDKLIIPFC